MQNEPTTTPEWAAVDTPPADLIAAVMPCGAAVTNVCEAYEAGKRAAAPQPAVDTQWKLVPVEPTPAMSAAGFLVSEPEHDPAGVYRAMLAAAPQPAGDNLACKSVQKRLAVQQPAGEALEVVAHVFLVDGEEHRLHRHEPLPCSNVTDVQPLVRKVDAEARIAALQAELEQQRNALRNLIWREDPDAPVSHADYPTLLAEVRQHLDGRMESMKTLQAEIERLRAALAYVIAWEFPATGKFWEDDPSRPMSWAACHGSNGEREHMREVARKALQG